MTTQALAGMAVDVLTLLIVIITGSALLLAQGQRDDQGPHQKKVRHCPTARPLHILVIGFGRLGLDARTLTP